MAGVTPITDDWMLIILALDPGASVHLSPYTGKWLVEASIEIGNGSMLTSPCEHADSPDAAIRAFFARLTDLAQDEYVVTRFHGRRREWRWNGRAFAECTREEVLQAEAERLRAVSS